MNADLAQNGPPAQILAVDDTPDNLRLLTEILAQEGYQVRVATSGALALKSFEAETPDLVLLDVRMPGMDGYEVCRRLKAHDKGRTTPVIFVSALDDAGGKVAGFEAGGVDYVTKPFEAVEVLARVNRHLDLQRLQTQLEMRNAQLQDEIARRARVEDELRQHKEHLEERVAERTAQLARTNEALERARADAERANMAKTMFLANMSHELRTPMNSILGFTDRLRKKQLDDPMQQRDLMAMEIVDRNAKHLLELINSILDISRIEAGRMDLAPAHFDLRDAVRHVLSQAEGLPDAQGLVLIAELPDAPMVVEADRVKIVQALANLVANAVRYTQRGTVTITAASGEDESLGSVLRVTVQDTGVGIKREDIGRLFTAFTQLDTAAPRRVGGTGLGLVIARQYARMHGGRIDVESVFGTGSAFTLVLPRRPIASPSWPGPDAAPSVTVTQSAGSSERAAGS